MKLIENSPKEVQDAMTNILDVFGGGDGGGSFYKFCCLINSLSENLNNPEQAESAKQLLDIILKFDKLIEVGKNV
jgi:hypothetical protein